jgi:activator of HSP90 ATPase
LVQDWFFKKWKNPSRVSFKLINKGKETELNLLHKNIPNEDATDINHGWKDFYIGPLMSYLEKK